jgi:aspartokinase
MEKVKIGGVKLNGALCQFDLKGSNPPEKILAAVSNALSVEKINIEFLTYHSSKGDAYHLSLCVNEESSSLTSSIFQRNAWLPLGCEVVSRGDVGMVTLFPCQSAFSLAGIILTTWMRNSLPIYGVVTSLSAISVLTDFRAMDKVVELIEGSFQLPDNHAPFKPEIRYTQSSVNKTG